VSDGGRTFRGGAAPDPGAGARVLCENRDMPELTAVRHPTNVHIHRQQTNPDTFS